MSDPTKPENPGAPKKVLVKTVHLYSALELMGAKTSVQSSGSEMEVTPLGLKVTSRKNGRVILVPWSNIKGCELMPEIQLKTTPKKP